MMAATRRPSRWVCPGCGNEEPEPADALAHAAVSGHGEPVHFGPRGRARPVLATDAALR